MNSLFRKKRHESKTFSSPFILLLLLIIYFQSVAQTPDSTKIKFEKELKNCVKINLTSFILYSAGIQLNHERLLSLKSSITIFGGYIEFPMPSVIFKVWRFTLKIVYPYEKR